MSLRRNNPIMLKVNRLRKLERDAYNRAIAKGNEIRIELAEELYFQQLSLEDDRYDEEGYLQVTIQ